MGGWDGTGDGNGQWGQMWRKPGAKYGTIYAFKAPWYEIETHISHNLNFGFVKLDLKKGPVCKLWRHSLFLDWLCWFYFRPTWNSPWDHCRQYCWLQGEIQSMLKKYGEHHTFSETVSHCLVWLRAKFQISLLFLAVTLNEHKISIQWIKCWKAHTDAFSSAQKWGTVERKYKSLINLAEEKADTMANVCL